MRALLQLFPAVPSAAFILIFSFAWGFASTAPALAQSDPSDQFAATRVLGPNWQQLCRHAGMIFAGTVLAGPSQSPGTDRGVPSVEISLRVDRAIAGVEPGQVLTIREWTGALSSHPTMHSGERLLLFLYPPSRLGLTSPVGGARGQIRLDAWGVTVSDRPRAATDSGTTSPVSPSRMRQPSSQQITLAELERAIRGARGE
jgi:hypothetical protein